MKTHHILPMLGLIGLCSAAPAFAAESTADFVKDAAMGNMFEIESSKIAADKAQNPDVKKYAQQMVTDHTKVNNELKADAGDQTMIPTKLDSEHQDKLDKLRAESGKDFDKTYVSYQVDAHEKALSLYKSYAKDGDNTKLKNFSSQKIPELESHQDRIKQLQSSI